MKLLREAWYCRTVIRQHDATMDRRTFIAGASGVFAIPRCAFAQQPGKVWRIGYFYFASRQSSSESGRYKAFVQAMRELGYVEGKNLIIEARYAAGKRDRLPSLAAELVQLKVDAIVATGSPTYNALRHANTTIPVIVTLTADPVIEGLAATLARPGGNFTGLTNTAVDLGPKQLELLASALPQLSRLGVLLNPDNLSHPAQVTKLMLAAQNVGVQVVVAEANTVSAISRLHSMNVRSAVDLNDSFGSRAAVSTTA
jgi:putative ABC transport system substrate-binding protein